MLPFSLPRSSKHPIARLWCLSIQSCLRHQKCSSWSMRWNQPYTVSLLAILRRTRTSSIKLTLQRFKTKIMSICACRILSSVDRRQVPAYNYRHRRQRLKFSLTVSLSPIRLSRPKIRINSLRRATRMEQRKAAAKNC